MTTDTRGAVSYPAREIVSGLGFLEGPLELIDGTLLVTDVASGWIHAIDPRDGSVTDVVRVPGGPSALAVGPDGRIYICSGHAIAFVKDSSGKNVPAPRGTVPGNKGTAGIYVMDADGRVEEFLTEVQGHPLVAPNDLVFDEHGGFYFTDHGAMLERTAELGGLYYVDAQGAATELIHEARVSAPLTSPNGLALSPDGKKVYVAETPTGRVWEWDVAGPGVLAAPEGAVPGTGAKLLNAQAGYHLFDSMAVDADGFLAVGTLRRGGVTIISPDGASEEFLEPPIADTRVTNVCFGGEDLKTAYVTAADRGSVWAFEWPRSGFPLHFVERCNWSLRK